MNFTLKQLRYLEAALRSGSIAKAAQELNISQSSVTAAIDQLEDMIGAELFRRIPAKGIIPTRIGTQVGERVAEFLSQARIFESDLLSMTGNPRGTLRLACFEPTAPYVLPELLKQISVQYPDIRMEIIEGDMAAISTALRDGAVDLALTYLLETHPDHLFAPFFAARPFALIPDTWPLCGKPAISLSDLSDYPFIMLDLPGTRNYFDALFSAQGAKMKIAHSTKSGAVLRGLVAAQFGYALLNICGPADRDHGTGYTAVPLAGDIDSPMYGAAYVTRLDQSPIVRAAVSIGLALAREGRFDRLCLAPH
ncbi:LysR family transcriptional regulator [Leisingera sp. ANG59]|uniref:LysR family transcriptional regulator n=1 Tax=Leisingera sp. ANG59 TaxID=2675221 RepID=UPI001572BB88|nr:LysR family transcriptional regulator [Leisingera sp. ANG59]